jgi:hypothetical protein
MTGDSVSYQSDVQHRSRGYRTHQTSLRKRVQIQIRHLPHAVPLLLDLFRIKAMSFRGFSLQSKRPYEPHSELQRLDGRKAVRGATDQSDRGRPPYSNLCWVGPADAEIVINLCDAGGKANGITSKGQNMLSAPWASTGTCYRGQGLEAMNWSS